MSTTKYNQKHVAKPVYQAPIITTYTAEELLDIVGPVQAGGSDQGDMGPMGDPGAMGPIHKILKVV